MRSVSTYLEGHISAFAPMGFLSTIREGDRQTRIVNWLAGVLAECIELGELAQSSVDHLVRAIELCLSQLNYDHAVRANGASALLAWQEQVAKAMLLNDMEGQTQVEAVAKACGMSHRHFSRAFKATIGLPPQRWRLMHRIEKAKSLMLESEFSLTSIAYECGFAEQSHFNHTFYKLAGESPGAWRRRRLEVAADLSSDSRTQDASADHQLDTGPSGR